MHLEWLKDPETERAVDLVGPYMANDEAWLRLALACLDQAGISQSGQVRIERAIKQEGERASDRNAALRRELAEIEDEYSHRPTDDEQAAAREEVRKDR